MKRSHNIELTGGVGGGVGWRWDIKEPYKKQIEVSLMQGEVKRTIEATFICMSCKSWSLLWLHRASDGDYFFPMRINSSCQEAIHNLQEGSAVAWEAASVEVWAADTYGKRSSGRGKMHCHVSNIGMNWKDRHDMHRNIFWLRDTRHGCIKLWSLLLTITICNLREVLEAGSAEAEVKDWIRVQCSEQEIE